MNPKNQQQFIYGTIIFIAMLGSILATKSLWHYYRETPRFGSYSTHSKEVGFHDNCAVDMRAFVTYNGEKIEMSPRDKEDDYASFQVPHEALGAKKFTVQSMDRNGNKSKPKTLVNLEGIIVEEDSL